MGEIGMRLGAYRVRMDGGHLAFVAGIAAFCVWYWLDARDASTNVQNLLLIQPAALLALALCLAIAVSTIKLERLDEHAKSHVATPSPRQWRGLVVAGLLALYVAALLTVGFDLATFAFMAGSMFVLGERRPLFLIAYSVAFAVAMSYAFKFMLSVPMPTVLF